MKAKKLTKREFARAIKLGHGRALLHLMEYGDDGIEGEIEQALITNYVFDSQIEGTRTDWLMRLIPLTGRTRFYALRFLELLKQEPVNHYNRVQQIKLCGRFFELGFEDFRELMFRNFKDTFSTERESAMSGCEVVDVGGQSGLEFVARILGANPNVDDYECATILKYATEELNESEVTTRINELAQNEKGIRTFLDACGRYEAALASPVSTERKPEPSLEDVLAIMGRKEQERFGGCYRRFGRFASDADLRRVCKLLSATDDGWEQLSYLRMFAWKPLPYVSSKILDLLNSPDLRVVRAAATALSNSNSAKVRQLGKTMLESAKGEAIPIALELLESSCRPIDAPSIMTALKRLRGRADIHSAGMAVRSIAGKSGVNLLADCMVWLYEHAPCTHCRRSFVEKLIEWDKCPAEILFEAQWDAGDDVRALCRSELSSRISVES